MRDVVADGEGLPGRCDESTDGELARQAEVTTGRGLGGTERGREEQIFQEALYLVGVWMRCRSADVRLRCQSSPGAGGAGHQSRR